MTAEWDIDEITDLDELRRQLKVCRYERQGLQKRLDSIRSAKDQVVRLLEAPTLEEHLGEGGDVMDYIAGKFGKVIVSKD